MRKRILTEDDLLRSSTIVIANYNSHKNSKESADILINKGENAAKKINDAIQSLKGIGGEVKLMEGTYNIETPISIDVHDITLIGVGASTILSGANFTDFERPIIYVGFATNANNTYISNLTIDGFKSSVRCLGIQLRNCKQGRLENITVTRCGWQGIVLDYESSVSISNCNIVNNMNNGIGCYENSNVNISNCFIEGNETHGIQNSNESSVSISNCNIVNNTENGILNFENSNVNISNCFIEGNELHGVEIRNESSTNLLNCNISDNTKNGILCSGSSDASISSCNIYKNNNHGISVIGGHCKVKSNFIKLHPEIFCEINIDGGTGEFISNTLGTKDNTTGWGVYIWKETRNVVVANNVLIKGFKKASFVDNGINTITQLNGNAEVER